MVGSSTHGASMIGKVSEEIDPKVVNTRGESANAVARDHPRGRAADAQRLGDPQQTPEADGQQQRPPQPLGHPAG